MAIGGGGGGDLGAGFGQIESDVGRKAPPQVARVGQIEAVAPLDGLGRGQKQGGALFHVRGAGRHGHLDAGAGRDFEGACAVGQDDFLHREPVGTGFAGRFDLQAVVDFQGPFGAEAEEAAAGEFDASGRRAAVARGGGINDLAVGAAAQIEPGPGPGKNAAQVVGARLLLAGGERAVVELAVNVHCSGDVERRLLAAFDFKRRDAGFDQIGDQPARGEVLHREHQAAGFRHRPTMVVITTIVPAAGVFVIMVVITTIVGSGRRPEGVAAGIGAGAAVAGASAQERGVEAQAGIGVAQRAVQEGFEFDGGVAGDGAEFRQGEFAGEGDAGEAEAGGGADAFEVVEGHLGGGVQAQGGEMAAGEAGHAEILHDDGVGAAVGAAGEGAEEVGQFGVAQEGVERDVHAAGAGPGVGERDDFLEVAGGEVDGFGAGGEAGQAGIDRVGAEGEGGVGGGFFAGGGEEFGGAAGGGHAAAGRGGADGSEERISFGIGRRENQPASFPFCRFAADLSWTRVQLGSSA